QADRTLLVSVVHATAVLKYAARVLILPRIDMPLILHRSHLILQLVQTRSLPHIPLVKGWQSNLQVENCFRRYPDIKVECLNFVSASMGTLLL
ncbi:hypothetical protein DFH28DRAFT_898277, partial [Melampsora americana]